MCAVGLLCTSCAAWHMAHPQTEHVEWRHWQVTAMDAFETADLDNNGEISLAEFRAWYSQKSSDGFKELVAARSAGADAEGADGDDGSEAEGTVVRVSIAALACHAAGGPSLTMACAPPVFTRLLSMTGRCECASLPDQRGAVSGTNERAGAEGEGAHAAVPTCRRSRGRGRGCPDVRHLHGCLPADAHTSGVSATHIVRSAAAVSSASRARLTCYGLVGAPCSSPGIECAFGVPAATGPSASIVRHEFLTSRAVLW